MKNTLYSLMLNDEVVAEIDLLARNLGATRSSLINEILAEYVNYTTPAKRTKDILGAIEQLILPTELVPFFTPSSKTLSIKSYLQYRYRPTIKYEISLFNNRDILGEMDMLFRTQSSELISDILDFVRMWKRIEDRDDVQYALYDGKFVRSIPIPNVDCTSEELANSISDYVKLFDVMLKGYLSGQISEGDIRRNYNAKKEDFLI